MDLLQVYEQFLELRQSLIADALKEAAYSEKRDTGNVRPLVILKSELHVKEWEKRINKLSALAASCTLRAIRRVIKSCLKRKYV